MFLQAVVSFVLLRREFRRKLTNLAPVASSQPRVIGDMAPAFAR